MAFKYVWRKESREGRLLDPDDLIEGASSWSHGWPKFNICLGYETEEDAVTAYKEAIKVLPNYYHAELVLIKVFSPDPPP